MGKRLFIDLERCEGCKKCELECSYFYHPRNNGVTSLRELAAFSMACRRCQEAPCVDACPQDALEKQENGILKRYNFRCIRCKSCAYACPFGTIYPEVIPYVLSNCDYCLDRLNGGVPDCVRSCPEEGVEYREVEESEEKNIYFISDHLAVHYIPWKKETKKT